MEVGGDSAESAKLRAALQSREGASSLDAPPPLHPPPPMHHTKLPSGGVRMMGPQNLMTARLPIASIASGPMRERVGARHGNMKLGAAVDDLRVAGRSGEPVLASAGAGVGAGAGDSGSSPERAGKRRRLEEGSAAVQQNQQSLRLVDIPPDWLLVLLRAYLVHVQGTASLNLTCAGSLARAVKVLDQKGAFTPLPRRISDDLPGRSKLLGVPVTGPAGRGQAPLRQSQRHGTGDQSKATHGPDSSQPAGSSSRQPSMDPEQDSHSPTGDDPLPPLAVSVSVPVRSPMAGRKRQRSEAASTTSRGSTGPSSSPSVASDAIHDLLEEDMTFSLLRMMEPVGRLPVDEAFGVGEQPLSDDERDSPSGVQPGVVFSQPDMRP